MIVEAVNIRCPNTVCQAGFSSNMDGCCAMMCTKCGIRFCWLCLSVTGNSSAEAHSHVLECSENPEKGNVFVPIDKIMIIHSRRKIEAIRRVLGIYNTGSNNQHFLLPDFYLTALRSALITINDSSITEERVLQYARIDSPTTNAENPNLHLQNYLRQQAENIYRPNYPPLLGEPNNQFDLNQCPLSTKIQLLIFFVVGVLINIRFAMVWTLTCTLNLILVLLFILSEIINLCRFCRLDFTNIRNISAAIVFGILFIVFFEGSIPCILVWECLFRLFSFFRLIIINPIMHVCTAAFTRPNHNPPNPSPNPYTDLLNRL